MAVPAEKLDNLLRRWEAMRARVVANLRTQGWSEEDAQDLFGEALLQGALHADTLRDLGAAEGWFWRLAHRHAVDERRRRARRPMVRTSVDPDELAAEEVTVSCDCSVKLLEELPDSYRQALTLVDMQGMNVKDYADRASITANNASVRLFRARQALREKLASTCNTTSAAECQSCVC